MANNERYLKGYFKPLLSFPVNGIDRAMVASRLVAIRTKHGEVSADRARSCLSALYTWLCKEGVANENVVTFTNKNCGKERERTRVLTGDELRLIWSATDDGTDHSAIVRLLFCWRFAGRKLEAWNGAKSTSMTSN